LGKLCRSKTERSLPSKLKEQTTIKRGGTLAKGAVIIKVSKPNQDMRFDVRGSASKQSASLRSGRRVIAVEAGKTLLLERDAVIALANGSNMSVVAR
jgi:DUF1009 family protein